MKKIFLILLLSFVFVPLAFSQSMTDEQVVDFVLSEQEKGSDEKTIATMLIKKGVSVERLRRIKSKYEAENKQPGAVDLTGKTSRLRTKNKKENAAEKDAISKGNIKTGKVDLEGLSATQKQNLYQDEIGFFDIDSLMYYENMLNPEKTEVFGRNMFNNELLTFEPALNVPVPSNYILGAGDQVIIDVWGASQTVIDDVISPDGYLVVEGVGPLRLAGRTVAEANEYVKSFLGEVYADSQISLTVGEVRMIQVQVVGEVVTPGSYTLSALSTAFNALYSAGGISDVGTLRAINVYRNGVLLSTIDVYSYIFKGDVSGDVRLQDNDVISVGAYDAVVNVQGRVKRPMMYEMKSNESLSELIGFTGGFTGDAYKEQLRVVRKSGREYSLHTVKKDEMLSFEMCDGDSVYVDSIISRFSNMIEISGAVFYPGQYEHGKSIKTVYELVEAAGGVREDAFLNRAVLHHKNYDNTIEAQSINLIGILDGTAPDVVLRSNDVLYVPSKTEMEGDLTITVGGEVRFPGIYRYASNSTIEDVILLAGGLTRAASVIKVDVFRQIHDPKAREEGDKTSETFSFEIKDGFVVDGAENFTLKPFDGVYVRRSPVYAEMQNVTIKGAVNFEGEYAITNKEYRLSDLVKASGGLSLTSYAKGAYLFRKMTEEELSQRDVMVNESQIQRYEEVLKSEKNVDISMLDSLYQAKLNTNDYYTVAIDLESAIKKPYGENDVVLREGDIITVPQYTTTVKISGEVRHPISINWQEGKKLKHYVEHAGGYTDSAKKNGVYVIYMNGSVQKISRYSSKAIQPGCEIVIPRKEEKRKLTTAEVMSIGTATVSMASMIVTLINITK